MYGIMHGRTLQKEYDTTLQFRHENWEHAQLDKARHAYKESLKPKVTKSQYQTDPS